MIADGARMALDVWIFRVLDDAEILIFRQFLQLENDLPAADRHQVIGHGRGCLLDLLERQIVGGEKRSNRVSDLVFMRRGNPV